MRYLFEHYALDLDRRELRRDGRLVAVEPQVFDLMAFLVQHRTRVSTKDDLFAAIWNGRIVSDSALTTRLNAARNALGDSGASQRLIRTLRGRGVRFVGEVREVPSGGPTVYDFTSDGPKRWPGRLRRRRELAEVDWHPPCHLPRWR